MEQNLYNGIRQNDTQHTNTYQNDIKLNGSAQ